MPSNRTVTQSIVEGLPTYQGLAALSGFVLVIGTIFYHFVEKWDWIDSLYFCVITLTTVGYGDYTPHTDEGKLFTILYILIGLGILGAFISAIFKRFSYRLETRVKKRESHK